MQIVLLVYVPTEDAEGARSGRMAKHGGFVSIFMTGALGEERRALSKLRTDTPGTFIYPIKPVQESTRVYNQSVIEETFENER